MIPQDGPIGVCLVFDSAYARLARTPPVMPGPSQASLAEGCKPPCPRLSDATSDHLSSVVRLETTQVPGPSPIVHPTSHALTTHPQTKLYQDCCKMSTVFSCTSRVSVSPPFSLIHSFIELFIYHQCGFTIHRCLYLL